METFSALLAICVGNSPVTGEVPTQRPVTRSFCPRGIFIIFELLDLFDNVYIYYVISEQL